MCSTPYRPSQAYRDSPTTAPKVIRWAQIVVTNPIVAYAAIIALQLRVIWDVWKYKDLVSGDTSGYFLDAVSWTHGLHDDIIWSPLYTDVWGTFLALFHDNVYDSEMALRVAVIVIATVLVLAIMRSLVNPAIALMIAAWWAVVPANYNVLYEVHLFGVLPILVAALIVARHQTRTGLGIALAILLGTTALLRNEVLITALIVIVCAIVYELHARRLHKTRRPRAPFAYGIPLLVIVVIVGFGYWRSFDKGHSAVLAFRSKQDLNLCQAYAFNYQQRHPNKFTGNAFTECQPLMRQVFGHSEPSFLAATIADPRAMAAFVAWNGKLTASGLQVALFNATSTGDQPDYPLVETHRVYALILSLIMLALWISGALAVRHDWKYWRSDWFPKHKWISIVLVAECVTTLTVMLSERPRPEYMYALTVSLMALTGLSATAVLRRVGAARVAAPIATAGMVVLLVVMPSYYHAGARPLKNGVQRLEPVVARLHRPGSVLIAAQYNFELCSYLAATYMRHCTSPSWTGIETELNAAGASVPAVLNKAHATVIYAETLLLTTPAIAKLVADPARAGWKQVAGGTGAEGPWHVLVRAS
jgi:hypothetical protein